MIQSYDPNHPDASNPRYKELKDKYEVFIKHLPKLEAESSYEKRLEIWFEEMDFYPLDGYVTPDSSFYITPENREENWIYFYSVVEWLKKKSPYENPEGRLELFKEELERVPRAFQIDKIKAEIEKLKTELKARRDRIKFRDAILYIEGYETVSLRGNVFPMLFDPLTDYSEICSFHKGHTDAHYTAKLIDLLEVWESRPKTKAEEEAKKIEGIKNWNLRSRYYLLQKLGFNDLNKLKSSELSQKNKFLILANILNCSPRNAKKLLNGEEKPTEIEMKEVDLYLQGLN